MPLGFGRSILSKTAEAAARTPVSITANGDAQIDTAVKKFGTGSAEFDGVGDSLTCTGLLLPETGDWTVEYWIYPEATNQTDGHWHIAGESDPEGNQFVTHRTDGSLRLDIDPDVLVTSAASVMTQDAWQHVAAVREGDVFSLYVAGSRVATATVSSVTLPTAGNLTFGAQTNTDLEGYLDEIRVSDTARYTGASYSVPTTTFSNDANTLLLLHCDGTNGSTTFTDDTSAPAVVDYGYWKQTDAPDQNKIGIVEFDRTASKSGDRRAMLFSGWFKATNSDFDTANSTPLISSWPGADPAVNDKRWAVGLQTTSVYIFYDNGPVTLLNAAPANFNTDYIDGEWHHLWCQVIPGNAAANKIYMDGVDITDAGTNNMDNGSNVDDSTLITFANRADYLTTVEFSGQLAEIYWLQGSTTNQIPNLSKWYNGGHVDLGSDGTSSGAPTPDLWLTVSGGAVVQGGATSGTVGEHTTNGGSVTYSNTGGPGA